MTRVVTKTPTYPHGQGATNREKREAAEIRWWRAKKAAGVSADIIYLEKSSLAR